MELELIELDGTESFDFFLAKVKSKQDSVDPVKAELHNLFKGLKNYLKTNVGN